MIALSPSFLFSSFHSPPECLPSLLRHMSEEEASDHWKDNQENSREEEAEIHADSQQLEAGGIVVVRDGKADVDR